MTPTEKAEIHWTPTKALCRNCNTMLEVERMKSLSLAGKPRFNLIRHMRMNIREEEERCVGSFALVMMPNEISAEPWNDPNSKKKD